MSMFKVFVSCLMISALAAPVLAQEDGKPPAGERPAGRGGPGGARQAPLSPEKAKAAWELEAKSVAASLGLSDDKAAAVVKAYVEARTSLGLAAEKAREEHRQKMDDGEELDREAVREQMEALNTSERSKLEKSLGTALTAEQTKTAMATLGSFNRGWDQMVSTIAGFNLEAGKQTQALKAVHEFVGEQAKARGSAGPDADRDAMRTAMQSAREKLTTSLKGILSEEQLKEFQASMAGPGRGGRGGGGGAGGPGGPGGGRS
jgi:hypothetical protein